MSDTSIVVPDLSLVVLVGASGAGKSTFAERHFAPSEILSSDFCRLLVADDPDDQSATADAFEVLHFIAGKRLEAGRLTVVDATSVQREARASLIRLAREHHVLPVAVVLDVPEAVCAERNAGRPDRHVPPHALKRQHRQLRRSLRGLRKEGFRRVFVLDGPDAIESATVERERRWTDRRDDRGPFDFIGDVHGCLDELVALLDELGYEVAADRTAARHPEGRRAFFVGDLVDRGPDSVGVLRLAMGMVRAGSAECVPGNHENKLWRALKGRNVTRSHGLAETLEQLDAEPEEFRAEVAAFIDSLVSHAVLDDGRCVVAHAGLPERLQNRSSGAVKRSSPASARLVRRRDAQRREGVDLASDRRTCRAGPPRVATRPVRRCEDENGQQASREAADERPAAGGDAQSVARNAHAELGEFGE